MDPRVRETNEYRVMTPTGVLGKWEIGRGFVPYTADSPKEAWHIARQLTSLGRIMPDGSRLTDCLCILERKYVFPPAEALNPEKNGLFRSDFRELTVWIRVALGNLSHGWKDEPAGVMFEVITLIKDKTIRTGAIGIDLDINKILQTHNIDPAMLWSRLSEARHEYHERVKKEAMANLFPIVVEFDMSPPRHESSGQLRICATPDIWRKVWDKYEYP